MAMDPQTNVTFPSNVSALVLNDTTNCSGCPAMNAAIRNNHTATNITQTGAFPYSLGGGIAVGFTVSSVMFLIIVGNILVCVAVGIEKKLQIHQNFFLVSLAASDIMLGVMIMPFSLVYEIMGYWVFGQVWCDMWLALDVFFCTASIFNLCLIAIERHRCVTNPTASMGGSKRRQLYLIVGAYIAAAAVSLPPLFGWKEVQQPKGGLPQCPLRVNPGYVLFSITMSFYIPLAVMIIAYVRLFQATRAQFRKKLGAPRQDTSATSTPTVTPSCSRNNLTQITTIAPSGPVSWSSKKPNKLQFHMKLNEPIGTTNAGISQVNGTPEKAATATNPIPPQPSPLKAADVNKHKDKKDPAGLRIRHSRARHVQSKERRFTLIIGLVMGAFIICWYPFFQLYPIKVLCKTCHVPDELFGFWFWVGYCNSALNPIIYTVFNVDFRKVVVRILTCGKRGASRP
ncbi:alpha-2C adrenergic receptor-like [Branchiostoma floridae]|uniref:Alpha-2C adrenergic receptor-like n=1 Tax=Branchiostoma floridae TaxID=7739 RepID=A0A9J7MX99_BRAFL|nr:alpha-2C adrenergic receptor-like [Branchiostoma floridae]